MTWLDRWSIRAGRFFFHYRNGLFPVAYGVSAVLLRPGLIVNPTVDRALGTLGFLVVLLGELVRLATIGFEYIERGGKNKQVYASHLVRSGVYGLTRNPMYVGNLLVVIGVAMIAGSPWIYGLTVPFFLFVYWSMVRAEEAYLLEHFGSEYAQYCRQVSRFFPSFRRFLESFTGIQYNWRRAIRQELSTLALVLTGLVLVPVWRTFFLNGAAATQGILPRALALEATVLAAYGLLIWIKKRRLLLYD